MKTTIFLFHPDMGASRLNRALSEAASAAGITVRDIYALYPDGRIDVEAEKKAMEETDRIVLQFPIYWYSTPSLLKEWEDRVLEYGWAYGQTGDALHGKELLIVASSGANPDSYTREGMVGYSAEGLMRPFHSTSKLIGTRFLHPFLTFGYGMSDEDLAAHAAQYVETLGSEIPELSYLD